MEERTHKQALPPGCRLQKYRIVGVLGVGGFGVTYLAEDETLDRQVAVREYLPNEFAVHRLLHSILAWSKAGLRAGVFWAMMSGSGLRRALWATATPDVELGGNHQGGGSKQVAFRTLTIGRHPDADVRIDTDSSRSVSRTHAEITIADGRYYLIDRNSSYGTRVLGSNGWQEHRQGYVDASARVRFGDYETSLADLFGNGSHRSPDVEVPYEPLSIRPRRNPGTGEVEV